MLANYPSLVHAFQSNLWAILPEKLEEFHMLLRMRLDGLEVSESRINEVLAGRREDGVIMNGRVAVLPVMGTIAQRSGMLGRSSGGASTEAIGATLEGLVADRSVGSIVMQFDSPGGAVSGVMELADKIRQLGAQKKIVGVVDSMAASAAYWLATQTSELNITPGGMVGSIGVLGVHVDTSKADEIAGVKTTYITSSKYKAEKAPEMALSDEAKGDMQAKADHYHQAFVKAIARGRGVSESTVNNDFGQGRMLVAKDAVARGMADRIATMEQTIGRLGGEPSRGNVAASIADAQVRAMVMED